MNPQKVKKLIELIELAGAVNVGSSPLLTHVKTFDVNEAGEDVAILANWESSEGLMFEESIKESDLSKATIDQNKINVLNAEGDLIQIDLFRLTPINISEEINE